MERPRPPFRGSPVRSGLRELALVHVNSDRVEAAYRRTDLFECRRVMQQWAKHVTAEAHDQPASDTQGPITSTAQCAPNLTQRTIAGTLSRLKTTISESCLSAFT